MKPEELKEELNEEITVEETQEPAPASISEGDKTLDKPIGGGITGLEPSKPKK